MALSMFNAAVPRRRSRYSFADPAQAESAERAIAALLQPAEAS